MPYRQRIPHRVDDVDVDDAYYPTPVSNRSSMIVAVIFLLVIVGFFFNQSGGFRSIGTAWESRPVNWPTEEVAAAESRPVIAVERPVIRPTPRPRPQVVATPIFRPAQAATVAQPIRRPREAPARTRPSTNVVGYSWVTAPSVSLRTGPGTEYNVTYLLPENWLVAVLGESALDNNNETWARVRVETNEGIKAGWLNRKYLSY